VSWRETDDATDPPQQVASRAAEKASTEKDTILRLRCPTCQAPVGSVRRTRMGLLFRGLIPQSPKELGLLGHKERGKQAGER
jgi:hypothetical protein